ncbi:hypothetical protein OSSY52_13470 [Tepiditoga spiralis]|uniref:Permease n=1 Tax=Tepiditoga spiralis TaxID=2108365 RepID=A0A7G1G788_9BACT|nr:hypothetical protein [Tepiditoga spiralis]BBE31206.1 hypothetical protein OSSY52_13470 [Tepiditoga spiralis]
MKENSNKSNNIIKNFFIEFIILIIAIILMILNPNKALSGIMYALKMFFTLFPIIISVAFLTGFISEIIPKKTIAKIIGKESGIKGKSLGAFFGMFMVGPTYAFYPFFKELIDKGASVGVIATTIGSWAIKIQWLPFALGILGAKFVLLLNFFILIYSFIIGFIMDFFFNLKKHR